MLEARHPRGNRQRNMLPKGRGMYLLRFIIVTFLVSNSSHSGNSQGQAESFSDSFVC